MQRSDQCILFSSGIPLLLDNSCLDSSKEVSTEDFAGDGQVCDSSPVVTDVKVAFLRESFSPVTWDSLFVPNGLEKFSQDSGSCSDVGLQQFSMNVVYVWGFSTLHNFDGVLTYASVGGLVSMVRSSGTGGGSVGSSGWRWFRTSQKCSTHLSACSRSVAIVLSSLPFTVLSSPLVAVLSASAASPSTKDFFSLLALFFTSLSLPL